MIADVGQNAVEEVNFVRRGRARGVNFGWRVWEGRRKYTRDSAGRVKFPVLQKFHSDGWCSITGGYIVRDPALRALRGRYVYGDFCLGQLRSARLSGGRASGDRALSLPRVSNLSSFGEDAAARVRRLAERSRLQTRRSLIRGGEGSSPSPRDDRAVAARGHAMASRRAARAWRAPAARVRGRPRPAAASGTTSASAYTLTFSRPAYDSAPIVSAWPSSSGTAGQAAVIGRPRSSSATCGPGTFETITLKRAARAAARAILRRPAGGSASAARSSASAAPASPERFRA